MVCPLVQENSPRVLASGLSLVHVHKPWYNYFIPTSSVRKYFVRKFAIYGKVDKIFGF